MNDTTPMEGEHFLKRVLLLCLCAALLCSAAFADPAGVTDMASTDKLDRLYEYCMLPDGRIVFAGWMMDEENSTGRLLCVNPDGTVCWEYEEPEEGSSCYWNVFPEEDGTLAVSGDFGEESKVIYFTPDGKPAGKELPLQDETGSFALTSFGRVRYVGESDESEGYREFTDRDGRILFRWKDGSPVVYAQGDMIPEDDGLVLSGWAENEAGEAYAVIMKADWQGETLWKTPLPALTDDGDTPALTGKCLRTGDGGYVARLREYAGEPGTDGSKQNNALIRFGADGQILWMNRESFDKRKKELKAMDVFGVAEYKGKYVAAFRDREPVARNTETVWYLWFDENGNELGTTEARIRQEDVPRFADSTGFWPLAEQLISLRDGLWQVFGIEGDTWVRHDNVMVRVPEL